MKNAKPSNKLLKSRPVQIGVVGVIFACLGLYFLRNSNAADLSTANLDTSSPTVSFATPANNSMHSGDIGVGVNAQDNVAVTKVRYFIDNQFMWETTNPGMGYAMSWSSRNHLDGIYELRAEAFDAAGNKGVSPKIQVRIQNGAANSALLPGDVNGSGKADIIDVSILLSGYGKVGGRSIGDLTRDAKVDIFDLSVLLGNLTQEPVANAKYVSTQGNDANAGTMSAPFRTLQKAVSVVQPGQTIYMRGGVYVGGMTIGVNGTSVAPITIASYPGERAVFDGTGVDVGQGNALLKLWGSSHAIVRDIELRNSSADGLAVEESNNVTIRNSEIHHTVRNVVKITGDYITVSGNHLHNGVLMNQNGQSTVGWGAGLSTNTKSGSRSRYIQYINNTIHDMWGECMSALQSHHVSMLNNRIYNCWSVSVYLDNADNVTVNGNHVYKTSTAYNRSGDRPATGILFSSENYPDLPKYPMAHITVTNNLVTHLHYGIGLWYDGVHAGSTYHDVKLYNNVLKGNNNGLVFPAPPTGIALPSNNEAANNIVYDSIRIDNPTAWTASHNNLPAGQSWGTNNITSDPLLVNGSAVGDPNGYKLSANSPLKGKGLPKPAATHDFWGILRSTTPTIGIQELL